MLRHTTMFSDMFERAQEALQAYNVVLRTLLRLKRAEACLRNFWLVLHRANKVTGVLARVASCQHSKLVRHRRVEQRHSATL